MINGATIENKLAYATKIQTTLENERWGARKRFYLLSPQFSPLPFVTRVNSCNPFITYQYRTFLTSELPGKKKQHLKPKSYALCNNPPPQILPSNNSLVPNKMTLLIAYSKWWSPILIRENCTCQLRKWNHLFYSKFQACWVEGYYGTSACIVVAPWVYFLCN